MNVDYNDLIKFKDFMFKEEYALYDLQYNIYHQFMEEYIYHELQTKNVFYETYVDNLVYKYKFLFKNIKFRPPNKNSEYMFPQDAREKHLTYSSELLVDVTQVQEIHNVNTKEITTKQIGETETIVLTKIPIMVRSRYCTTNLKKNIENKECKYDPGCYFIINGNEKIIIGIEKMTINKFLVFKKKDITYKNNFTYIGQINSKYKGYDDQHQVLLIRMKKDHTLYVFTTIFNEIPLIIFLRALGLTTEKHILELITQNLEDNEMLNILRYSLNNIIPDPTKPIDENNKEIKTQEDAINFLITKIKNNKRFSTMDANLQYIQKKMLVEKILKYDFLPHMDNNVLKKGYFICLILNKYLNVYLKRIHEDDRDSYTNKRIDMPGKLLFQLFKQLYNKLISDINKYFKKKNYPYPGNDEPINVINQIKSNVIEQGFKSSLMTGNWGTTKKKGVSQALQRYTYLQTLSAIRRANSPSIEVTTSKVTSIRHVHGSQYGFICPVETPEGAKVGLMKNFSLTTTVSINNEQHDKYIIDLIKPHMTDILNINYTLIPTNVKVFLNGNWLGITNDPNKIIKIIDDAKRKNIINYMITAFIKVETLELIILSDGGRLMRPLLRVVNNKILLTKDMIKEFLSDDIKSNIKNWNHFLLKYPDVIEYVDTEKSEVIMIAGSLDDLKNNEIKYKKIINNPHKHGNPINRYDDTVYVNYTHCEIHPSLYLGTTSSNIPFCEHNQGPRNMFNYSQSRQAMGYYATNERYRIDNTFRLMHSMTPIVITQSMKYLKTLEMPAGENCMVAISCYSGYNVEDSLIFNNSSIERGLFRAFKITKYNDIIVKNPNTSQDDIFTKPDRERVIGMKDYNYDLLNDKGYVAEETEVNNRDIIIGKVSPIKPTEDTDKIYKDNSIMYKSGCKGKIDKVEYGVINNEGYEMCNVKIRSERTPVVGDKVCSRAGQKGTGGILLNSVDMPFTKDGIQPDLIVNPNAIPSRMTIGQLLECLVGKIGALKGSLMDATPFQNLDIDGITKYLEDNGYNRYGYETLYCGMTGKKIKSQIFIGPTYYLRLKHLVQEKIHSRAKGPKTILTRQPPEGRTKDGGLRFGEMERDCLIAHGMSQFLKERLVDSSDLYFVNVCSSCGLFASKMIEKDVYECKMCNIQKKEYTTHKIAIPYGFKLLIQELQTINILPRIKVNRTIYNSK